MSETEFAVTKTSFMVDLEEYMNYLIHERCSEIHAKIIRKDPEYQDLQAQIKNCFQELQNCEALTLNELTEKEDVSETLSEIIGVLELLTSKLTYRQGLKDGGRLGEWIFKV
jgi:hypothetical protein